MLRAAGEPRAVAAGTALVLPGAPQTHLHVVEAGAFEALDAATDARLLASTIGPGQVVAEIGVLTRPENRLWTPPVAQGAI